MKPEKLYIPLAGGRANPRSSKVKIDVNAVAWSVSNRLSTALRDIESAAETARDVSQRIDFLGMAQSQIKEALELLKQLKRNP